MGSEDMIEALLIAGGVLAGFGLSVASICVISFLQRGLMGDRIFLKQEFYFHVSTWIVLSVYFGHFVHIESFCDFICYTYPSTYAVYRVTLILFFREKLCLLKELHWESNTSVAVNDRTLRIVFALTIFSCVTYCSNSVERLVRGGCIASNQAGACFIEAYDSYWKSGVKSLPALFLSAAEAVFSFQFVRSSLQLCEDRDFVESPLPFQQDVMRRMYVYSVTSFVTLATNLVLTLAITTYGFVLMKQGCEDVSKCVSESAFAWFLFGAIVNTVINLFMVIICSPWEKYNILQLAMALYYYDFSLRSPDSLTPEQLKMCEEFDRDDGTGKVTTINIRAKGVSNFRRPIEKSWYRCPVTKRIMLMDTPSLSTTPTGSTNHKKQVSQSSSGVEMAFPEDYDIYNGVTNAALRQISQSSSGVEMTFPDGYDIYKGVTNRAIRPLKRQDHQISQASSGTFPDVYDMYKRVQNRDPQRAQVTWSLTHTPGEDINTVIAHE